MKKSAKKSAKKSTEKSAKKVSAKKVATKDRKAVSNPFKVGQKVTYDGKKFEVRRAYSYNGLPLCIIANDKSRHMVSANKIK